MAPHCSHFYVLVKRKPLNMNLIHFDYLTLVWFIGIDKSQIIEMLRNYTFYGAQNKWPLSVGVTTTTNIQETDMLRIILLLSVGKGSQIDILDKSRLNIQFLLSGLCIYSNTLAYTDSTSDMRTELFKWIDTDVKVYKKVQVLSKLF